MSLQKVPHFTFQWPNLPPSRHYESTNSNGISARRSCTSPASPLPLLVRRLPPSLTLDAAPGSSSGFLLVIHAACCPPHLVGTSGQPPRLPPERGDDQSRTPPPRRARWVEPKGRGPRGRLLFFGSPISREQVSHDP